MTRNTERNTQATVYEGISRHTHRCWCCCTERSRVARTKVNSVGRIPGRLSPPLDYTRFVGARNRSSDRRRVKGSEEDEEREREESRSRRREEAEHTGAVDGDLLRWWEKGERREAFVRRWNPTSCNGNEARARAYMVRASTP